MATPLGMAFSTNEKVVSQCDNQTFRSTVEMLVIEFNQKKFEELLPQGSKSPLSVHKHSKVWIAKAHLANSLKLASVEAKQAQGKPKTCLW